MNVSKLYILGLWLSVLFASCKTDTPQQKPDANVAFKHHENIVYCRLAAEPDQLNPLLTYKVYARTVYEQIFAYLLKFDPTTLELEPYLAKARPEQQLLTDGPYQGGVAYTFEIREEARWEDGAPVTGADVAFTLKAILNPKVNAAVFRSYLDFVRDMEIDADNPQKFTVVTDRKYILGEEVVGTLAILPAAVYDPEGIMAEVPFQELANYTDDEALLSAYPGLQTFADEFNSVKYAREKGFISGAGPYRFETWEAGQHLILQKKENWWGEKVEHHSGVFDAFPDQLYYKILPDQTAALANLKDEALDVASQIDTRDFREIEDNQIVSTYFNLHTPATYTYYYIGMNNHNVELADPKVRRALAHLLDIDQIIETLYYGLAERTVGPIHPSKKYYHKGLNPIPYDVAKAQSLLQEAGWRDSNGNGVIDKQINGEIVEMELDYLVSSGSKFGKNLALIVQNNTRKAGVEVKIVPREFNALAQDLKQRNFDLFGGGWSLAPSLDDPKQVWHTSSDTPGGSNRVGFGNAESDAVIDSIRLTLDENKRDGLYRRFQEIVYEQQPVIFLFTPNERIAIHKRFEAEPSLRRPGFFPNAFVQKDIVLN